MSDLPSKSANSITASETPKVGDILISSRSDLVKVTSTSENEKGLIVYYQYMSHRRDGSGYWAELKSRYGSEYRILHGTLEDVKNEALRALADPDYLPGLDGQAVEAETTALALRGSSQQIEIHKRSAEMLRNRAIVLHRMIGYLTAPIKEMVQKMQARIDHLGNMLSVLEAYAGVYESVTLIRDGQPAPTDTPISIRQLVLYMDEEAGITDWIEGKRGITWRSVEHFDEWILAEPAHLQQVAPEAKCIVAIKPSRRKENSSDRWLDVQEEQANMSTYILIRNGEKIYRVATGYSFGEILYPRQGEFLKVVEDAMKEREANDDRYSAQGVQLGWQRNIAILQGLIERTDVFKPLPHDINLFRPETIGDALQLIRDAEMLLPDGHLSWRQWQRQENLKIQRGDRIIFSGLYDYPRDDHKGRFLRHYHSYRPSLPHPGVYTVERVRRSRHHGSLEISFLYMPDDEVYTEDGYKERTSRVSFLLYANENCVLRYESLDLATLDYYISCRSERPHFLTIMDTLREARRQLVAEQAQEDQFVALLASRHPGKEDAIREAIAWWKTKVISKRPILSDDAKAWRMITQRIKHERIYRDHSRNF